MVRRRHLHSPVITAAGSTAAVTPLLEQTTSSSSLSLVSYHSRPDMFAI